MNPPGRPLVLFDFDGTLADTWRDLATAVNRTLSDAGLAPVAGQDVKAWIGDGAMKLLARALPEAERADARLEAHFERFRAHYEACCLDTTALYPGMAECLDALDGLALAVLSNKPGRFLERIVADLGLAERFEVVMGGDALDVRKPDPAVVQTLIRRLDETPEEIWMVGDSAIDVRTGLACGAHTIGCRWGLRGVDEMIEAGVDHLVDHPDDIAALVLGGCPEKRR